jgi:hypothetical protein
MGSEGTTLLVVPPIAALAARWAAGAAVEVSGEVTVVGSVGGVIRAPAAARRGSGSSPGRPRVIPSPFLRVQTVPEVALGHLPAEDVHQAHGDPLVGNLVPMDRILMLQHE